MHTKTPRSSEVKRPLSRKYIDTDTSDSDADTLHVPATKPHSITYRNRTDTPHIANSSDSDDSIREHNLTPQLPLQHFPSPSHNQHMTQTASKCPRTVPTAPLCTQEACVTLMQDNQLLKEQIGLLRAQNTRLQRECQDQRPASELATANTPQPGLFYDRQTPRENKMVELVRGSYVFLYESQLNLVTESAKSMSALARLLVDVFFPVRKTSQVQLVLREWSAMSQTIISFAVSRDLKKQSPSEIRQSLRNKLGCLRAPSRKRRRIWSRTRAPGTTLGLGLFQLYYPTPYINCHGDMYFNGERAGCVELLSIIQQRLKPKYHIFGHIHEGYGITTDGQTQFINATTCTQGFTADNTPIVFDYPIPKGHSKAELLNIKPMKLIRDRK